MEILCPCCRKVLEYSREPPRFCGYCGQPLETTAAGGDATLDFNDRTKPFEPISSGEVPSERFGDYRLVRKLGQGGMGVVYEAEHASTGRRLALKLLPLAAPDSSEAVERFLREGKLAASISHPRSTFVYSAGEIDGQFYIAMELMTGGTVKDVIDREGPLPIGRAVDYLLDALDGLEAAHALGVVHRDVKPSNCFLDGHGRVKVGDYGLSKSLVGEVELTRSGAFLGTPLFAAPEQVKGEGVDARTDIYALGATLFFLLTGRGPFTGDAAQVIARISSDPAPPLRSLRPDAPKDLERIVARTLEKDPARRYADVGQLRRALAPFGTRGASIADLGRRLAAFFVDLFVVGFITTLLYTADGLAHALGQASLRSWALDWSSLFITLGYFTVLEGGWGRGVGKWLLGLRVVDAQGTPPGMPRAGLRATLLLAVPVGASVFLERTFFGVEPATVRDLIQPMLLTSALEMAVWGAALLMLVSMRRSNGYRGVHELLTGTRVASLRRAGGAWRHVRIPVTLPSQDAAPAEFGPYVTVGLLGQSRGATVWQARDRTLERDAWIWDYPEGTADLPLQRIQIARPTRPHWLQGGSQGKQRWDAFEPVHGAPLDEVFSPAQPLSWEETRTLLADLAAELRAALADGSLPASLAQDQLWVDQSGQLKLLDAPLRPRGEALDSEAPSAADAQQACTFFRKVTTRCVQGQPLPGHAREFLAELASRPATAETLAWAAERLEALAGRPARLHWDYRLGVLAMSLCAELPGYFLVALAAALAAFEGARHLASLAPAFWSQAGWFLIAQIALGAPLAMLAPAVLGFALRGGPVFRVTGVEVLRRDGSPAGRLRCAWRNTVSWFPFLAGTGLLFSYFIYFEAWGPILEFVFAHAWIFILSMGMGAWLFIYAAAGAAYAVLRPTRGLQDGIAGSLLNLR